MSLLDSIEVQGVRSIGIGPNNAAVVDFLSPLTIICGPNGTGKTTIIESLKYATTNELPSGKMPAFIHDYRLANRTRVDASVKLKFRDIRGRSCVVTRRMNSRAEYAKGKMTTKSEESTIAVEDEYGEVKSLSSKVIDTRKEVLNLLGVPAAILEYVVFCHQEESTWPLDEPKKLKERFDEIFQVTSYVKSIDALKTIQKQNQQELRTLEATLPHLVRQEENKIKLQDDVSALLKTIEKDERKLEESEINFKRVRSEWDDAKKNMSAAEEAEKGCKILDKEISLLNEQVNALSVPDYQRSIEELRKEIELYKSTLLDSSKDYIRVERNRKQWEEKLNSLASQMKSLASRKDALEKEIRNLKASELMRSRLIKEEEDYCEELCKKYGIPEESHIEAELNGLVLNWKKELSEAQDSSRTKQLSSQKAIDDLTGELAVIGSKIKSESKESLELESLIKTMGTDLAETKGLVAQAEDLKKQIRDAEERLNALSVVDNTQQSINHLKKERDKITLKIKLLNEECHKSEAAESIRNASDVKNREISALESQLSSLLGKHENALDEVFNKKKPIFPIRTHLNVVLDKVVKAVSHAEDNFRNLEKEKNRLQSDMDHFNEQIDNLSDEIYSYKNRIEKVVPFGDSVETRLEEVNKLLNKSRTDLGLIDGCRYLYEKWETEAKERKCCPLCERKYKSNEEVNGLVTKVSQKRLELPTELNKMQRRVKEHEELQKELMEVVPFTGILKNLQHRKSDLEVEVEKTSGKILELESKIKEVADERNFLQDKQGSIFNLQTDASLMDNIWQKCEKTREDLKQLSLELDHESNYRSTSEIRKDIAESEERYNDALVEIDALQAAVEERSKAVDNLNSLREKHLNLGKKAMEVESLEKTLVEKKCDLENKKEHLSKLEKKKPFIEEELQKKLHAKTELLEEEKAKENYLSQQINELLNILEKLSDMRRKSKECQSCSESLKENESSLAVISMEIEKSDEESRMITGKLDRQERGRRLDDQLRKMELYERITNLCKQKEETLWTGKPINDLKKMVQHYEKQFHDLTRSMERKTGEIEQKRVQLAEMKKRLNSKEFSNSEAEYKRSVITKCVTEKVVEDLAVYIRVLDESVVKFHSEKMEEINEVLGQLWDQVYRGGDIETIQIKSESVNETEKKKSYNYRVVMTVDGSEIDMPGRCSAGQKMLASILIRIALSDVFCDKCSIIALDEPTTNLDVLKVENLGDMLAQIIEARCSLSKKNFQLIVITHDDRFVEHLRQLCRPEWVYALYKDSAGLSKVKRHRNLQDAGKQQG